MVVVLASNDLAAVSLWQVTPLAAVIELLRMTREHSLGALCLYGYWILA